MNLHIRRGPFRVNGGIATRTPQFSQSDSGAIRSYCSRHTVFYIQFQEMLKELEKQKPYTAPCAIDTVPISLEFADPDNGNTRFFDFQVRGILDTHIKDGLPSQQFDVLEFLCGIKFLPTCSIGNGVSWLELYALFLIHTKQTQAPTTAKAGASLAKRLRDFTSRVRSVVRGFLAEEDKVHFKPSLNRVHRLQELCSKTICQPFASYL